MTHHVFIDNSNIFGGAQSMSARVERHVPWPALRVHFRNLALLVEGSQQVGSRVLAGSVPPGNDDLWSYARDMKYETNLLRKIEKGDGRLGEQGVDELLHLKVANLLLDSAEAQALVLVTGDGRVSQFGTGFALQAERALKRGWQVEIWSWKSALSPAFGKLSTAYGAKIRIHDFDKFFKSVTFVKGGYYGPPAVAKIVNLAGRIVAQLPSPLKVY
ncbi:MAG: NYN domain-containing protein [Vicinamibacterales bacterium]|jgi:hypothetical protein